MQNFIFQSKWFPNNKAVYQPTPTWGNHVPVFKFAGLDVKKYRYYDAKTCGFDEKGCLDDILQIPEKSIILLHACAHNPTGVDPTVLLKGCGNYYQQFSARSMDQNRRSLQEAESVRLLRHGLPGLCHRRCEQRCTCSPLLC
jgi:hypothetical protein